MKKIIFEKEARQKLLEGSEFMYRAVATTLGPKGRNVAIARQWGSPVVVHDGVTVARDVMHPDEFVNMGIDMIREAAQKTNNEAGDGTTTSTLLSYFIVKHGMDLLDRGVNPMVLRREMLTALDRLKEELKNIATPSKDIKDIERVAFISSADAEIGRLVAEAVERMGSDGLVTVNEGHEYITTIDYTKGMEFDKGYASTYFVTDPDRMEAVIDDPLIVCIDKAITLANEIGPLLETLARMGKNMVFIGDITGSALATIVANKMRGSINALVVKPPSYGDRKKNALEDIAILTGGTVFSDELGLGMDEFQHQFKTSWIGHAKQVVATQNKTMIIEGTGDKDLIAERQEQLRVQRDSAPNIFEKEKIEERLAKLTTGVAVIRVGAKTEIEMREKVERVKDAIGASKSAIEEGIVPGGGVTFLRLRSILDPETSDGEALLYDALAEPIKKILINAGETNTDSIIDRILKAKDVNTGYEMNTGKIQNMITAGVIDPAKVIRLTLENAISVASSILTTECLIADEIIKPPTHE